MRTSLICNTQHRVWGRECTQHVATRRNLPQYVSAQQCCAFSFVQSFFTAFVLRILLSLKFKTQKQYTVHRKVTKLKCCDRLPGLRTREILNLYISLLEQQRQDIYHPSSLLDVCGSKRRILSSRTKSRNAILWML